jgi:hypothetical protein
MKTSAYHFFLKYAGYSYQPGEETRRQGRIRCAKALATAERDGQRFGLRFEWEWEEYADDSWMSEEERALPHEWTRCTAVAPDGRVLANLGGIVDADATYRRVVEAELAAEALAAVPHIPEA